MLADDEPTVRSALRLLLEQEPNLEVVGEVDEAGALADWFREGRADVLIIDWELPGLLAPDLCRDCHAQNGTLKLVALSGRAETRAQALAAGVDGFISKTDPPEQVLARLRPLLS